MKWLCHIIGHDLYGSVCGRCYRDFGKGDSMNLFTTADAVRVDSDERGFALIIDTEDGDKLYVNIHAVALEFEASVRANLRPYALEAEHARATMPLAEVWPKPVGAVVDMDLVRDLERGK